MSTTYWLDVAAVSDIPQDDVVAVDAAGKDVAVYNVGGHIFATDNLCTHGNARLCDGFLEGHEIECPLHQGKFDVRDGRATCAPVTVGLTPYPVKIESGRVFLQIRD